MKRKSIKKYSKEQQEVIINIQPGTKALIYEGDKVKKFEEQVLSFIQEQQQFNKRIETKVNNLETKINKHHPE